MAAVREGIRSSRRPYLEFAGRRIAEGQFGKKNISVQTPVRWLAHTGIRQAEIRPTGAECVLRHLGRLSTGTLFPTHLRSAPLRNR